MAFGRTKTVQTNRGQGLFFTDKKTKKKIFLGQGRVTRAKLVFPQGKGVRLTFTRNSDIRNSTQLVRIKQRQARAERKEGVRVGNGLFDNPLKDEPKVIGVVKIQRRKQQNPKSGKKPAHPRKGSKVSTSTGKKSSKESFLAKRRAESERRNRLVKRR